MANIEKKLHFGNTFSMVEVLYIDFVISMVLTQTNQVFLKIFFSNFMLMDLGQ